MSYYQYIATQFIWEYVSLTHGGILLSEEQEDIDYNDTSIHLRLYVTF